MPATGNGSSITLSSINLNGSTVIGNVSSQAWLTAEVGQTYAAYRVDNTAAFVLALGMGVSNGTTSTEAIASTGVITVNGESGARMVATFSRDASHTVTKTITLTSTSSQAVVLTSSDVSALGDGTISVSVTQSDRAGNTSTVTTTFVLDTTAPATPTVTLGSGIDNTTNNGATSAEAIASNGVITVGW